MSFTMPKLSQMVIPDSFKLHIIELCANFLQICLQIRVQLPNVPDFLYRLDQSGNGWSFSERFRTV